MTIKKSALNDFKFSIKSISFRLSCWIKLIEFSSAHDFIDVLDFFLRFLDKSLLVTTAAISILLSFSFSKVGSPKDVFPKKIIF